MIEWWNEGAAELLRETMEARGLSAPQLAGQLNVTDRTVRNWTATAGRPTRPNADNLRDLCAALAMTREEFRRAAIAYNERQRDAMEVGSRADDDFMTLELGPASTPRPLPEATDRTSSSQYVATLLSLAILAITIMAAAFIALRQSRRARGDTFELPPVSSGIYEHASGGQVSPDGTKIAFLARSVPTQRWTLFVFSISERTTRALPKSEGNYTSFFWHADSRSIFFITDVDLMKVNVAGEGIERVGHAAEALKGTVNHDGVVILGSRRGLMRIDETGNPELLTRTAYGELAHSLPFFLPDETRVLFVVTTRKSDNTIARTVAILSIADRTMRKLFPIPTGVEYVNGHLLYVRDRKLVARRFDVGRLEFTGDERIIAAPVWSDRVTGQTGFSSSANTIVITPPPSFPPVYHVSAGGGIQEVISEPTDIRHIAVGHVSNQIALVGRGPRGDDVNLWLYSPGSRERVQRIAAHDQPSSPLFSRDDRVLYYAAARTSWASIYALPLRGHHSPRVIIDTKDIAAPRDISPDGRFLLFQRWPMRDGNLWSMPVGDPTRAEPFIATPEDEGESARFSPDGRHVAFVAKRGNEFAVYVTDFPPSRPPRRAMQGHGWRGRWSIDGRRIYFVRENGVYEADPLTSKTRLLFRRSSEISLLETARDGGFFIRETPVAQNPTVATQWWPRTVKRPLDLSSGR